jgi:phospholipase C
MSMTVDHIFVLMLENRSFDQMLGFSGISGADAVTGNPTKIAGLAGTEGNPVPKRTRRRAGGGGGEDEEEEEEVMVFTPADVVASADPGHEFPDVEEQLCGEGGRYSSPSPPVGSVDPAIKSSGFIANFAGKYPSADWATPIKCFTPEQLPVLTTLAKEFALCDHWFSSMPGPTWPNRFFVHAASAGGLDHSPNLVEELGVPYSFENGTIFDRLDGAKLDWAIYTGDEFPQVLHMDGMLENLAKGRFRPFSFFASDLKAGGGSFSKSYVFIEPDWHPFTKFKGGNSQHPADDVIQGERLIKETYEAIRNSPVWERSLLIITYDEHGGFYDHIPPPVAVEPGDKPTTPFNNKYGFGFGQLGVRVPAIVVSPFVPRGVIDHGVYDHSSIPATIEERFGLTNLTERDKQAARLIPLLQLKEPRTDDAPSTLPAPAALATRFEFLSRIETDFEKVVAEMGLEANGSVDPSLAGFVHIALLRKLATSAPAERDAIIGQAKGVKSDVDAVTYIQKVRKSIRRDITIS